MLIIYAVSKALLTLTLQLLHVKEKLKSQIGCKGRKKTLLKSVTSQPVAEYLQLESVTSLLSNMHKRRAATDFGRAKVSVVAGH